MPNLVTLISAHLAYVLTKHWPNVMRLSTFLSSLQDSFRSSVILYFCQKCFRNAKQKSRDCEKFQKKCQNSSMMICFKLIFKTTIVYSNFSMFQINDQVRVYQMLQYFFNPWVHAHVPSRQPTAKCRSPTCSLKTPIGSNHAQVEVETYLA